MALQPKATERVLHHVPDDPVRSKQLCRRRDVLFGDLVALGRQSLGDEVCLPGVGIFPKQHALVGVGGLVGYPHKIAGGLFNRIALGEDGAAADNRFHLLTDFGIFKGGDVAYDR